MTASRSRASLAGLDLPQGQPQSVRLQPTMRALRLAVDNRAPRFPVTIQDVLAFVFAVIVLLGVPGPTNTLLAASGAAAGFTRSLRLVPAELGGYLTAITILDTVAAPLTTNTSVALGSLKLVAATWLAISAIGLWRRGDDVILAAARPIGAARVFVTTLLNPKALVVAFALLPQAPPELRLGFTVVFALLVIAVGSLWIGLGRMLAGSAKDLALPNRVLRGASLVLACFAAVLIGSVLRQQI